MSRIGKLWAGKIYGTNTGNLFAELNASDGTFDGILRIADDRLGLSAYNVSGKFDGTSIELEGKPSLSPENTVSGNNSVKGSLSSDVQIRGQWSSSIGSAGTFVLLPHDAATQEASSATPLPPDQLHTASRSIGALRLYSENVQELIGFISRDFSEGRVIFTYRERGHEVSRYASDIENGLARLGELRYLKLFIQAHDINGINKFALVELNADGVNEVRVQGTQESWVIGKAETVASLLKTYQKTLATTFRSFGLNINGFLALGTLVALPELTLSRRLIFVVAMAFIGWLILEFHTKFIPNVIIYLSPRQPSQFERLWPQILSWLIAATSAVAASAIYGLLKGEISFPIWISRLFTD